MSNRLDFSGTVGQATISQTDIQRDESKHAFTVWLDVKTPGKPKISVTIHFVADFFDSLAGDEEARTNAVREELIKWLNDGWVDGVALELGLNGGKPTFS